MDICEVCADSEDIRWGEENIPPHPLLLSPHWWGVTLSPPLTYKSLGQDEVLIAICDAWLDHCTLKPLIKARDGDPFWLACYRCRPTRRVKGTIPTRDLVAKTAFETSVIITRFDPCGPDFVGAMRAIIGRDAIMKAPIDSGHIVVDEAPVSRAEQVDTVKYVQ